MRLIQVMFDFIRGSLLTTQGDIVIRGADAIERLGIGTVYQVLRPDAGATIPAWVENDRFYADGLNLYIRGRALEIGDWNMDLTPSVSIAHGLTLANIINFSVVIREDDSGDLYNGGCNYTADQTASLFTVINDTNIVLSRLLDGTFDNALFDATSYNRGFITFWYKT